VGREQRPEQRRLLHCELADNVLNNFNVLGFVDNTETIEPVTNSWYLTSIQAGFEPSTEEYAAGRWFAIAGRRLCGVGPIGPP
jgi:hypothetical protein